MSGDLFEPFRLGDLTFANRRGLSSGNPVDVRGVFHE